MALYGGFKTEDVACTAVSTTSGIINFRGYAFGSVLNESGGSVTLTYYTKIPGGTPRACQDSSAAPITQTVADNTWCEIPIELAGFAQLIPVLASGTATLTFHLER